MVRKVTTYQEDLINALKNPREASAYLNAAMEEGDRAVFLLALRNVAEAQGGMAALARKTRMNRESLYRMLSSKGNPEIRSILTLLNSMELRLVVEPKTSGDKRQAEEVIRMLKRERFTEIPPEKIKEEPYRTIDALPSCFDEPGKKHIRRQPAQVKDKLSHYSKKNQGPK